MTGLESRFLGCLVGVAVGDALGEPFEGFLQVQLDRIPNLELKYRGRYTDDTQLTLAVARALIESKGFNREILIKHYINWLSEPPIGPGYGCLSAIYNLAKGVIKPSDSGGNGTAMRVSPIGLLYHRDEDLELLKEFAKESSILTHNHWAATAGAIIVARAVAYVVKRSKIDRDDFLETLITFIEESEYTEFREYLKDLKRFFEIPPKEALKELGLKGVKSPFIEIFNSPEIKGKGVISGFTIPTVLCSLYTFLLTPNDYMNSVELVIRGGGDTDTTAAICGAISGAFNGIEKIPESLINNLKDVDMVIETARELYRLFLETRAK
ncbi:MAG: ADP-ribosylglycohydrolase family protein [Candidatus Helarchaeota archaeon]